MKSVTIIDGYGNTIVTYTRRVASYCFFIVSIEPVVIIMQSVPELPAWRDEQVRQRAPRDSRWVQTMQLVATREHRWCFHTGGLPEPSVDRSPPGEAAC